jgi:DNA sulfur modification protein DndE
MRPAQARAAAANLLRIGILTALIPNGADCAFAQVTAPPTRTESELEKAAGFSQAEAARAKALEAFSDAIGFAAATWGGPLVTMYNLRYNDAVGPHAKAKPNTIWRMDDISTPELSREAGYVTPNVNTLYGFGFLDLSAEPMILSVPDSRGRYYMVEIVDFWTNAFAYAGGVATGYKGGRFALVGPGWKGKLPGNLKRIDCPTRWVLVQPRVHVRDRADLPAAREVLAAITVQGLSSATGKPAPSQPVYHYAAPDFTDAKLPVSALSFKDPIQFWEILADALIENPAPPDQTKALLPLFKPLGLTPGQPFDRAKADPVVLESLRKVAEFTGKALALLPNGSFRNGWVAPAPTIGNFGVDYYNRAVTARNGLTANIPREAIYIGGVAGSDGEPLSGAKRYTVTFKAPPPYIEPGFWSLTLYSLADNYTIPNPLDRYSLGSDDKTMRLDVNGSLTIAIQKDSLGADREANWLPAPAGDFYLILRAYAPGEALLRSQTDPDAFILPPIAVVEQSP